MSRTTISTNFTYEVEIVVQILERSYSENVTGQLCLKEIWYGWNQECCCMSLSFMIISQHKAQIFLEPHDTRYLGSHPLNTWWCSKVTWQQRFENEHKRVSTGIEDLDHITEHLIKLTLCILWAEQSIVQRVKAAIWQWHHKLCPNALYAVNLIQQHI